MKKILFTTVFLLSAIQTPAHAISDKYRQQLEHSGCTEITESQGCDVHNSKAQNAKAGFADKQTGTPSGSPYQGVWVAKNDSGKIVSTIKIDSNNKVKIDGEGVNAKKSDGGLIFSKGHIRYIIQGDRRLKNEDTWHDNEAGTSGKIFLK